MAKINGIELQYDYLDAENELRNAQTDIYFKNKKIGYQKVDNNRVYIEINNEELEDEVHQAIKEGCQLVNIETSEEDYIKSFFQFLVQLSLSEAHYKKHKMDNFDVLIVIYLPDDEIVYAPSLKEVIDFLDKVIRTRYPKLIKYEMYTKIEDFIIE